jgi:hypothetical protein
MQRIDKRLKEAKKSKFVVSLPLVARDEAVLMMGSYFPECDLTQLVFPDHIEIWSNIMNADVRQMLATAFKDFYHV